MRSIELADYLVLIGDGATVLCQRHAQALAAAYAAAGQQLDVFDIHETEQDEMATEPMSCQACHMAAVKDQTLQ